MPRHRNLAHTLMVTLLLSVTGVAAGDIDQTQLNEIHQLIAAIETSNCQFIRNGSRHDSDTAANHLRLKLKRGGSYISNSEEFIDRLASKSSWSGKAYTIECPNQDTLTSSQWLHRELLELRN